MKQVMKKIDIPLFILTIILLAIGLVMIFSASNIISVLQYKQPEDYFFKKQLIVIIAGLFLMIPILLTPTKTYKFISFISLTGVAALLILLKTYGTVTNDAQSWISILGFRLQPSEFAKTALILFMACYYGSRKKLTGWDDMLIGLIPSMGIFAFVAMEPDLGTALIIMFISAFMFYTIPIKKFKPMNIMRLLLVIGLVIGLWILNFGLGSDSKLLSGRQLSRLTYKNPCSRYLEDTGYQVCNGYIAINNGGMFGSGLGKSSQKYLYLPEAYTDFIFPIIVEEIGLVGAGVIYVLYLLLLYRILVIARNAKSLRGSMVAFGTFSYILTHIIVNMGGLLALIPLTGVPLPFLSYGGSFMMNLLILLGATQRVAIETKEKRIKESRN